MSDDCPEDTPDPDILPRHWGFPHYTVLVRYDEDYSDRLRIMVATPTGRPTTTNPFGEAYKTWHRLGIRF